MALVRDCKHLCSFAETPSSGLVAVNGQKVSDPSILLESEHGNPLFNIERMSMWSEGGPSHIVTSQFQGFVQTPKVKSATLQRLSLDKPRANPRLVRHGCAARLRPLMLNSPTNVLATPQSTATSSTDISASISPNATNGGFPCSPPPRTILLGLALRYSRAFNQFFTGLFAKVRSAALQRLSLDDPRANAPLVRHGCAARLRPLMLNSPTNVLATPQSTATSSTDISASISPNATNGGFPCSPPPRTILPGLALNKHSMCSELMESITTTRAVNSQARDTSICCYLGYPQCGEQRASLLTFKLENFTQASTLELIIDSASASVPCPYLSDGKEKEQNSSGIGTLRAYFWPMASTSAASMSDFHHLINQVRPPAAQFPISQLGLTYKLQPGCQGWPAPSVRMPTDSAPALALMKYATEYKRKKSIGIGNTPAPPRHRVPKTGKRSKARVRSHQHIATKNVTSKQTLLPHPSQEDLAGFLPVSTTSVPLTPHAPTLVSCSEPMAAPQPVGTASVSLLQAHAMVPLVEPFPSSQSDTFDGNNWAAGSFNWGHEFVYAPATVPSPEPFPFSNNWP
ncbi:hypothetical protein MIND_01133800 [Mycena indigotica]|uniref:Uncharacterized protein n=1 Tax=Mycena indigotica TaxID=2126181 RepID=A0A8H6VXA1_9AGAR|nr:uncharacterized protein MIND_01133800 [Mycena indigotica]KAF7293553.1 hypothetical protein MIND_01133800 [Mycena indigotica]